MHKDLIFIINLMSLENNDLFERMMFRMGNDFPECMRLHVDWEFVLKDKITREIKNKKKFRVLAIQNNSQDYQHVAIIISKLGHEYIQIPGLVEKFHSEIQNICEITSRNNLEDKERFRFSQVKFSRNVYLYTDKLMVPFESVQKHFQLHNLVLLVKI